MFDKWKERLDRIEGALDAAYEAGAPERDRRATTLDGSEWHARHARIVILGGPGHGDHARALAFASGVREGHPAAHIAVLMQWTGDAMMVEHEMASLAKECGVIDDFLCIGGRIAEDEKGEIVVRQDAIPREVLLTSLRQAFFAIYDCVPYAVGHHPFESGALIPFRLLYDGHPDFDWRLRNSPLNIWEIMSASSGIEVTPADLSICCPVDCSKLPDDRAFIDVLGPDGQPAPKLGRRLLKEKGGIHLASKAKLKDMPDYVVLNTGAGRGGGTKKAPPEVWRAVVSYLEGAGIRSVQIGHKDDDKVEGAVDRRGLRLPLSCRIIRDALCMVTTESFPAYLAAGIGKAALVLFGSTPTQFSMGEVNCDLMAVAERDGAMRSACPMGTCFRVPGYGDKCPLPDKVGRDDGYCLNIPSPLEAAQAAEAMATAARDIRDGTFTVTEEAVA